MDSYIKEIKTKIETLREMDKNFEIFGSIKHKYKLNPCKTEKEILEFEKKYKISLPEDYKNFLIYIGNGGAGPSYGMLRLEDFFDKDTAVSDNFLVTDFKYSPDSPYLEQSCENTDNYSDETAGSMIICHHGCGILNLLIISGTERGKIWLDDRCNDNSMKRVCNSFSEWYNKWLDNSISSLKDKDTLLVKMKKSSAAFKITGISGLGRARGLSVSCSDIKQINKIYYYEDTEFLENGAGTALMEINQQVNAALIIPDNFNTKILKQDTRQKFLQSTVILPDKDNISHMMDNARTEFSGIVTDIIWNSLEYKYYYICYAEDIKMNIFIESRKDLELKTGHCIFVSGILSFYILDK